MEAEDAGRLISCGVCGRFNEVVLPLGRTERFVGEPGVAKGGITSVFLLNHELFQEEWASSNLFRNRQSQKNFFTNRSAI
jgi:hypothetical protein